MAGDDKPLGGGRRPILGRGCKSRENLPSYSCCFTFGRGFLLVHYSTNEHTWFDSESEAWIWYHLTELIYGPGSATLSEYNGWTTLVTLKHPDFWADQINYTFLMNVQVYMK